MPTLTDTFGVLQISLLDYGREGRLRRILSQFAAASNCLANKRGSRVCWQRQKQRFSEERIIATGDCHMAVLARSHRAKRAGGCWPTRSNGI